ncbi:MAG: hypothetical protein RIR70_281 [Pseudomonadota bacterium]
MKPHTALPLILAMGLLTPPAIAQEALAGDARLACEALLCLSSGTRPQECAPALSRYFGIGGRKWSDVLRGRISFLNLCPVVSADNQMRTLANDIANGAGRCDAASLNAAGMVWRGGEEGGHYISNVLPGHCAAYTQNAYTDLRNNGPRYVGLPEKNGYWVEAAQYAQALRDYNARLAAENAARAGQ